MLPLVTHSGQSNPQSQSARLKNLGCPRDTLWCLTVCCAFEHSCIRAFCSSRNCGSLAAPQRQGCFGPLVQDRQGQMARLLFPEAFVALQNVAFETPCGVWPCDAS